MSFLSLVAKNLFRQPVRAFLACLGIAVGITTVVALGVIVEGFKNSSGAIMTMGEADFFVAQNGASDLSFSTLPESTESEIAAQPGVERTAPAIFHITRAGANPFFFLLGLKPSDISMSPPPLVAGRLIAEGAPDEVLLGDEAAAQLGVAPGDPLKLADHSFQVVGVYHTGEKFEDNGGKASLTTVQEIAAKPGSLSVVYVYVVPGTDVGKVADAIEKAVPLAASIVDIDDYDKVDQGFRIIEALNAAIIVIAVGVGAIGVMNTMVMSVYERTREIGVLRAVGWSGFRVLRMIVTESLLLCLVAAIAGTALGVAAVEGVMRIPAVKSLLEPEYSTDIFVRALGVAVVVALVGAAYPAYRAIRLTPMEALRYE
ncbi:MAG: ABC transporter permease [Chloroflexi bacterium]|nr:ABC transporter permease [Chloroflexota bacterium]